MLRRFQSLLGVVAVLAFIVVGASLSAPVTAIQHDGPDVNWELPESAPDQNQGIGDGWENADPGQFGPDGDPQRPFWGLPIGQIMFTLALAATLVLASFAIRNAIKARREREEMLEKYDKSEHFEDAFTPGDVVVLPELAEAVDEALTRLAEYAEPRDAVVAAWVELEKAGNRCGVFRQPAETATEYTQRLLDRSPAPPAQTAKLRALYLEARFAEHPVTAEQVAGARTALEAIARSLEDYRVKILPEYQLQEAAR